MSRGTAKSAAAKQRRQQGELARRKRVREALERKSGSVDSHEKIMRIRRPFEARPKPPGEMLADGVGLYSGHGDICGPTESFEAWLAWSRASAPAEAPVERGPKRKNADNWGGASKRRKAA